jgi:hypothetical protein
MAERTVASTVPSVGEEAWLPMKRYIGLFASILLLAVFSSCSKKVESLTAPKPDAGAVVADKPTATQPPAAEEKPVATRAVKTSDTPPPPSPHPTTPPTVAAFDGSQHSVSYSGSYEDILIPSDPSVVKVTFTLDGADGGSARVHDSVPITGDPVVEFANGGAGASASATFDVGTGGGKIPHGSLVRFVVGGKGSNGNSGAVVGAGFDYGGGGGGTAVLMRPPLAGSFTLLAVAGGGSGAYQGMFAYSSVDHEPGQGGRSGTSGGSGNGDIAPGSGGSGGDGGGGNASLGGGGGGATGVGGGVACIGLPDFNTNQAGEGGPGLDEGGYGGSSGGCISFTWRNGGFGYGGGGAGSGAGGGGGGYSGGGVGGTTGRGGGGGSYVAGFATDHTITAGGSTSNPGNGAATYQFTLNAPPTVSCKAATVHLDANGQGSILPSDITDMASDPEGGALQYSLSKSSFDCSDVGANDVTLTVTDDVGQTASCVASVTVVDDTSPVITGVEADPALLWPPDHSMEPVNVAVSSTDNCTGTTCRIIAVASNEPQNGLGDGDTPNDWQITGDGTVMLRAERSGTGSGRVYTITVECTDASGNKTQSTKSVLVPHQMRASGAK